MSHTPVRDDGSVFKRKLNAIRPFPGAVPPPVAAFTIYRATAETPAELVVPPASTMRATFMTHLLVSDVFTFEAVPVAPFLSVAAPLNGGTCLITSLTGSGEIRGANLEGGFNTTTGGARYLWDDIYPEADLGNPSVTFAFGTPVAAFGAYFTDAGESIWINAIVEARLHKFGGGTVLSDVNTVTGISGTLVFWGFTDTTGDTYTQIDLTLKRPGGGAFEIDPLGIDDVIYALPGDVI